MEKYNLLWLKAQVLGDISFGKSARSNQPTFVERGPAATADRSQEGLSLAHWNGSTRKDWDESSSGSNPSRQVFSAIPQKRAHWYSLLPFLTYPALNHRQHQKMPYSANLGRFKQKTLHTTYSEASAERANRIFYLESATSFLEYSTSNTVLKLHICKLLGNFSVCFNCISLPFLSSLIAFLSLKRENLGLLKAEQSGVFKKDFLL